MAGKAIDVEALSPRDANARRPRAAAVDLKSKAAAQLKASKEKEHPPPPPPHVTEPPSADRRDGAVYQVGKLLGKGGFAVCYAGVMTGSKKIFALKIVKSRMPLKMEQKFQTELQIHSKMRHPNIVQFFRAFSYESSTYLVLELCPNGSLMDMVKRRKGVTEPEVRFYGVQIAGAIKYMHAKGIIHRDLKMGNIFLDRHMNAKIGDFGLAALVVTGRDMQTIRRTTLCGTPNYIAPEILEKGKKGHDHMVDIWSLGIIMFAMLTSKPPFQSSTTDEIYRRAKERDYEWPAADAKFISDEAKHVVASMLEEAHMRPDPDAIVQHPFFVSGYMPVPDDMTVRLRDLAPEKDIFYQHPVSRRVQAQSLQTLKDMCSVCHVGPWTSTRSATGKPAASKAVWREMAAEEKAGLTPLIPLAEGIVYRPFETWLQENQLLSANGRVAAPPAPAASAVEAPAAAEEWTPPVPAVAAAAPPPMSLRAPPQSFAAQQRAQNKPARSAGALEQADSDEPIPAAGPVSTAPMATASIGSGIATTLVRRPSARRDVPLGNALSLQGREQAASASRPTTRTAARTLLPGGKASAGTSTRAATAAATATTTSTKPAAANALGKLSLFGPAEEQVDVPASEPDMVLARLRKLQAELDRALNARTMAFLSARDKTPHTPPPIVVKWVDYTNKFGLGYILNDGSVGCILRSIHVPMSEPEAAAAAAAAAAGLAVSDRKTGELPPACILVHGAEQHIQRRQDRTYADRHQILPMAEGPIYFYENKGEQGLQRVCVDPERFRVATDSRTGAVGKLTAGKDVYDHRKRERIVLWKKFANYMLAYGRELDERAEASREQQRQDEERAQERRRRAEAAQQQQQQPSRAANQADDDTPSDVVTFYQRFGDVGCWVFCDGHLQFNFPDHTKIVLDAGGVWCHFWHLPPAAAEQLPSSGMLDEAALDERSVLSYPLQTLLNFAVPSEPGAASASVSGTRRRPVIRPELRGIPAANDFRRKVEFVRGVVREWVANGGLGNSDMTRAGRLRWLGARETLKKTAAAAEPTPVPPTKHVWVTIGARQGDARFSALVDPRRPNVLGPDLEEKR